ncbi:Invasion associated locus B (IalB) protein [Pseudovibrio axinellae]|uniref:Invasion associated locus B (IalB) protein n=1 Tax=Pseudovibrio axinellae TaxID=989403 RepID=A0A165XBK2_9HYPH|nr:invasion associated locus B family protein [Pseudovibrio axinellae]KZL17548.1 Invasion associated locus B (IalB) protein [Pseudovibrio axinellae]SER33086.1 Invasion protein IalB, involved in pathogenesis [Pseudovibrio axinellae]
MAVNLKGVLTGGIIAAMAAVGFAGASIAQNAQAEDAWVKVCNTDPKSKKEFCLITQELRTDTGQFLAQAVVREVTGESRKLLHLAVPPGMLIQPGLRVQVDGGKQDEAKYTICFPNACIAEMVIDENFIGNLKKGGKLIVTTLNQQGKARPFDLTLKGFTRIYDGEAIKPEELQAKQERLQSELQKRAEAARQKLIEQQRQANQ